MGQEHSKTLYIYRSKTGLQRIFRGSDEYQRDVTKVTVDPSVTTLEARAFFGWRFLQTITLPNTLTTIGPQVFTGCSSLASITLPNSITALGNNAFAGCSSLTSITLPNNITTLGHRVFYGCLSLTSVRLPESLISIDLTTFEGCVRLTTIEAPYLSTTTLDNNNLDSFQNFLLNAGFSTSNPDDLISDRQVANTSHYVYYEWKRWARTSDVDGRFPLFTAAARCLKWSYMKQIFTSNMPVVDEIDVLTGLPLFMLAATGPTSDIESVYNLLKEYPAAMNIMNNSHD